MLDDPTLFQARVWPPAPDYSAPRPSVDAHDVRCIVAWSVVVLPDVTFVPGMTCIVVRPLGAASRLVLDRHNRHWERAHRARLQLPDAPI